MSEITELLAAIQRGDASAEEQLLSLVYNELRQQARFQMARESEPQTLQPTALVHEAWMRLSKKGIKPFKNRAHYFSAAAESMRRILIESARSKKRSKRGGEFIHEDVTKIALKAEEPSAEILAVHAALDELTIIDTLTADLVKLRYFTGMTMNEAANALEIPLRSAERQWLYAKAWLRRWMQQNESY